MEWICSAVVGNSKLGRKWVENCETDGGGEGVITSEGERLMKVAYN